MPAFVDSNVLVYAFTTDARATKTLELLQARLTISVQSLNDFANVARRKFGMDWQEVRGAISALRVFCPTILPLDLTTHGEALRLADRYCYSMFDALVVASALQANSEMLWSEDMHHGMVIDGRLRIANPFRKES